MSGCFGLLTRRTLLSTATAAVAALPVAAMSDSNIALQPLPVPTGDPVLSVSGKIRVTNVGNTAAFDMKGLEALPMTSFTTKTPWTKEVQFEGVLLKTLLRRLGAQGSTAIAYALNDYVVEIPLDHLTDDGPLLATKMNGGYMPVEKFGPIFVVYRFDTHPEWRDNAMYARCIWQLQKLVIR